MPILFSFLRPLETVLNNFLSADMYSLYLTNKKCSSGFMFLIFNDVWFLNKMGGREWKLREASSVEGMKGKLATIFFSLPIFGRLRVGNKPHILIFSKVTKYHTNLSISCRYIKKIEKTCQRVTTQYLAAGKSEFFVFNSCWQRHDLPTRNLQK